MTTINDRDIQAHPLVGHRCTHHAILFLRFDDKASIRATLEFLRSFVTSAASALESRSRHPKGRDQSVGALAFTHRGLRYMKLFNIKRLEDYGNSPGKKAPFFSGPAGRVVRIGDEGDWRNGWKFGKESQIIHAALILGHMDPQVMQQNTQRVRLRSGLHVVWEETGVVTTPPREPFGFRDAIQNTVITGTLASTSKPLPVNNTTTSVSPGALLLGHNWPHARDDDEIIRYYEWAKNSSFLTIRRLTQRRQNFEEIAQVLSGANSAPALKRAKAAIFGRWPNGSSMALYPDTEPRAPSPGKMDFSGDPKGEKCPVTAHVRMMKEIGSDDQYAVFRRSFRTDSDTLVFCCYQSSIYWQFEELMHRATQGTATSVAVRPDALLGGPATAATGGQRAYSMYDKTIGAKPAVVAEGMAYLWAPSIELLEAIVK